MTPRSEQVNPLKDKATKPASEPGKPPLNTHLALNTQQLSPLKRQTNPVQESSTTTKSITPVLRPSLTIGAIHNKRNPMRGAFASRHINVTSVRKSREDKEKNKGNKKEKQKKNKTKTKETVTGGSQQLLPLLPPGPISYGYMPMSPLGMVLGNLNSPPPSTSAPYQNPSTIKENLPKCRTSNL